MERMTPFSLSALGSASSHSVLMPWDMRPLVSDVLMARINPPRNIDSSDGTRVSPPTNECFQYIHISGPISEDSHPLQNLDLSNVTLRINCQSIVAFAAYFGEPILAW